MHLYPTLDDLEEAFQRTGALKEELAKLNKEKNFLKMKAAFYEQGILPAYEAAQAKTTAMVEELGGKRERFERGIAIMKVFGKLAGLLDQEPIDE